MVRKVVKLLGIRPSDSFGSDIVVFVEGRTDSRVFRIFEEKIREDKPELPRTRVSYIGVGGWSNMKYILSLELLKTKFVQSKAIAITDGDIVNSNTYLKLMKNWEEVFGNKRGFFSLKEESIESIFLNTPEVIHRYFVMGKQKKDVSVEEIIGFIISHRKKDISDKAILQELLLKLDFAKRYTSKIAYQLANQFNLNEIPPYLRDFIEYNILTYELS